MDADTLPVGLQELAGFGRGLTQVKVEINLLTVIAITVS